MNTSSALSKTRTIIFEPLESPVYQRTALTCDMQISGPAMLLDDTSTTIVEPGWQALLLEQGELLLERVTPLPRQHSIGTSADPIMLEIFNNLFMSIAEQMGATLANTAYSVNIKERLDFSCALFDSDGQLVANAPHMPVHLGSMGESVQAVMREQGATMQAGDVFVLNDPYRGGTHLPDVTVVTPVFEGQELLFYVASRGHHADIGGVSPGSMPSHSKTIDEEGSRLPPVKLVSHGELLEQPMRDLLLNSPWPVRNIEQNLADLRAQIAANTTGVQAVQEMIAHFGLDVVQAYMQHVQDNAEESVRRTLDALHDGEFEYPMDNGAVVRVAIRIDKAKRRATIDFTGTSPQQANNFNAPTAVCKAAVLYVFRTLVDDNIPLNAGCLKPIDIILPDGCLLNPHPPSAVVAGNVETSQYVVDALYGALGVIAAAQGTMNNLTFGNERYQYYETVCGGSGAGPDFDGTDAIHTHMTNSRLTDPEILESRFPVLLEDFRIREGSGGQGKYRGGHGVVRKIRFLEAMHAEILSGHRTVPPFGVAGGDPGQTGNNYVLRTNGQRDELGSADGTDMNAGDVFVIETPGGGGWGRR
ncbi:MAG: hydantoinase B/oxoprolinase family protein [Pseudomonadota bacterium]